MGEIAEFSLPVRIALRTYHWRRITPVPWAPVVKPLSECRLALVSSAAFVAPGQTPFDDAIRGGDYSFRDILSDVDPQKLIDTHRSESFDHSGLRRDPNVAFPIERVQELVARKRIGVVNHRHLSFMGSITAPGRLIRDTAPKSARELVSDSVDLAILVPV